MHARSSVVLFGLVIAFVAAGCGGGGAKKASPEKYVSTVCSSADAWSTGVDSYVKKLDGLYAQLTRTSDLPKLKTKLVSFLDGLVTEAETLQSSIEAVGQLDVKNGAKIAKIVDARIARVVKIAKRAKAKLEALPTNDATSFAINAPGFVSGAIFDLAAAPDLNIARLRSSELENAALNDATCQKIGSDNGVRFYVEPTRKNVLRFDYWYHYSGETEACTGDSAVGTPATGALSMIPVHPDGSFFYSALTSTAGSSFTISGIFDSPTSAHGTAKVIWRGVSCYFNSADVPWTANWKSVAQPS